MKQRRPLTGNERAVIDRLLSGEFPEVEYFRAQVDAITVISTCSCGCGTIDFAIDPKRAPRVPSRAWDGPTGPIVEGDASSWLMLFQVDGMLSELEHVPSGDPNPEQLDASRIEPDVQVADEWYEE